RHRGHLRPHPRDAAPLQAHVDAGPAQHLGQLDAVALDHHPRDGDTGAARLAPVRGPRHPQLRRDHDLRRGAGRHLYLGVHRRPDPDLSRRRHRAHGSRGSRREARAGAAVALLTGSGPGMTARVRCTVMPDPAAHCEALVRAAARARYLAALFAPAEHRGALHALYAFNLEVARVRELAHEPLAGEIRLQWWSDALGGERRGEAAAHPVAVALSAASAPYDPPGEPLAALIAARRFDPYHEPVG